jgi:hypothetical protein
LEKDMMMRGKDADRYVIIASKGGAPENPVMSPIYFEISLAVAAKALPASQRRVYTGRRPNIRGPSEHSDLYDPHRAPRVFEETVRWKPRAAGCRNATPHGFKKELSLGAALKADLLYASPARGQNGNSG